MSKSEIEKVKVRIKALAAKTIENGCTEAEAYAALNKVGELLTAFNLSMSDIDVREQTCKEVIVTSGSVNRHPIDTCVTTIADFCDCRVWRSKQRKKNGFYHFYGLEADAEMAEYLYKVIKMAMDHEVEQFKLTEIYFYSDSRRTASTNFLRGMSSRISKRLSAMKKDMVEEVKATGNSLVVLKGEIVERDFKLLGMKLKKHYGNKHRYDGDAYGAGSEAGNKVNLSRPINSSSKAYLR